MNHSARAASDGTLRRFWQQPCKSYRNHVVVLSLLAIQFVVAATGYTILPAASLDGFQQVSAFVGGTALPEAEATSRIWRMLAAANVMTLGLCCALLAVDLRRFYVVMLPLTLMKGYAAAAWLACFLADPGARFFFVAAAFDGLTVFVFTFFARRARSAMRGFDDSVLLPRPRPAPH